MSQENVEILRRAYATLESKDIERVAERFWHPDIEYREDPKFPGAGTHKGREAVLSVFKGYFELLGEGQAVLERVVDAGEELAWIHRFSARSTGAGVPHEHRWGYVGRLVEGKLRYVQAYYDATEALEAAGLREAGG